MPLALGDVGVGYLDISLLDTTPDVWKRHDLAGGETSFSSYVRARARGDDSVIALPVFLMRGFRHRCILVHRDSPAIAASDLHGARIGLTGWADSGNTWTTGDSPRGGDRCRGRFMAGGATDRAPSDFRPHRQRPNRRKRPSHAE